MAYKPTQREVDDYYKLIHDVSLLDINAAIVLREFPDTLEGFTYDGDLGYCFVWDDTPHGFNYWYKLSKQIDDMRGIPTMGRT